LKNVIRELVNSDKYYLDGDLSKMPSGDWVNSATYFCNTMAEVLNTKSVNCQSINTGSHTLSHYNINYGAESEWASTRYLNSDDFCTLAVSKGMKAEITTPDGVVFYQTNPSYHFGSKWSGVNEDGKTESSEGTIRLFIDHKESNGFNAIYKPFCIDIDGIGKGEDPFAYGIRYDGKIIMSKRAKEWLEKGFQKGKDDN